MVVAFVDANERVERVGALRLTQGRRPARRAQVLAVLNKLAYAEQRCMEINWLEQCVGALRCGSTTPRPYCNLARHKLKLIKPLMEAP